MNDEILELMKKYQELKNKYDLHVRDVVKFTNSLASCIEAREETYEYMVRVEKELVDAFRKSHVAKRVISVACPDCFGTNTMVEKDGNIYRCYDCGLPFMGPSIKDE